MRRKREDSDAKRRRIRAKSKGEDGRKDGGQRKLNCGYCGVATSSLRSSGLCDKCHAGTRAGNVDENPDISAPVEYVESTHSDRDRKVCVAHSQPFYCWRTREVLMDLQPSTVKVHVSL